MSLRRTLAFLLPIAMVAVLGIGVINGPANPDSLAFNDGSSATDEPETSGDVDADAQVEESVSVNQPPLAADDAASTTPQDESVTISVLDNDSDADLDELYIHQAELITGRGDVRIVSAGQELLFTPEAGSRGPWSVSYVVTDGADGFDQAMVNVIDGNQAPEAIDDAATATTQTLELIDVRANDLDDGDVSALRVSTANVVSPAGTDATVEVRDGEVIALMPPALPGTVIIEYVIEDRHGQTSGARVTVEVAATTPVAVDDNATTPEDTAVVVDVLKNDGPEGIDLDASTLRILTSSSGVASLASGGIRYDPPPDSVGNAQITYEICAISTACDTASVFIEVTPVFDESPFAADGQLQIPPDAGPQVIPWIVVSSGQTVVSDDMTFSIDTDRPELFIDVPAISSEGILTFEPRSDRAGTANTTITVRDSAGVRTYRLGLIIG